MTTRRVAATTAALTLVVVGAFATFAAPAAEAATCQPLAHQDADGHWRNPDGAFCTPLASTSSTSSTVRRCPPKPSTTVSTTPGPCTSTSSTTSTAVSSTTSTTRAPADPADPAVAVAASPHYTG